MSHAYGAHCAAFSPDGKTLVTGDDRGKIILWDLPKAKPRKMIELGAIYYYHRVSPDGKMLASCGHENGHGHVKLWNLVK